MEVNEINKKIEEVERVLKDLDKVMGDASRKKKEIETYLQALKVFQCIHSNIHYSADFFFNNSKVLIFRH